jgi:hypothetical protein
MKNQGKQNKRQLTGEKAFTFLEKMHVTEKVNLKQSKIKNYIQTNYAMIPSETNSQFRCVRKMVK